MGSGNDGALTSYLTRRPAPSSPFHFGIPALAPTSSLDDLSALSAYARLARDLPRRQWTEWRDPESELDVYRECMVRGCAGPPQEAVN